MNEFEEVVVLENKKQLCWCKPPSRGNCCVPACNMTTIYLPKPKSLKERLRELRGEIYIHLHDGQINRLDAIIEKMEDK